MAEGVWVSRELDRQVAEALGWFDIEVIDEFVMGFNPNEPGQNDWGQIPHYSTSIADAWTLVDIMVKAGWYPQIAYCADKKWECMIMDLEEDVENSVYRHADTAPLAICLAFLKWKEAQS